MVDKLWNGSKMCDSLSPSLGETLTEVATRLQAARHESLLEVTVPQANQTWEYAGREWSWPAGEELTYFRELSPKEKSILSCASENHGLEQIGTGTGRVVVTLPEQVGDEPLVAKLARYGVSVEMGSGLPQNLREVSVWKNIGEHPFLPILFAEEEGNWLIMPQADVIGTRDPDLESATAANRKQDPQTSEALASIRETMAPYAEHIHPDEIKPENVGEFDNQYWLLDYGRPPGEALFVDHEEASAGHD